MKFMFVVEVQKQLSYEKFRKEIGWAGAKKY